MKICLLDAQTLGKDIDLSELMKLGDVEIYDLTDNNQAASRIKDADVVITNKVVLTEENLRDAKNLKLIALTATGYNNVDIDLRKENGYWCSQCSRLFYSKCCAAYFCIIILLT